MQEEELKRELEKLSRDQAELRQRAEELARQMNAEQVRRLEAPGEREGRQGALQSE